MHHNGQDEFGYLEIIYDLINFLLVGTHDYQVVCVQGINCLTSVGYSLSTMERDNHRSFISFPSR